MGKENEIVTLNVPVLATVRDRLFEIQKQIHTANLSLTLQRVISDWHANGRETE